MIYLVAAFVIVWLLVTAYMIYLGVKQRQIEQEFKTLEEILQEKGS